jgi:cytochrome c-type biogenesis protein CcmE
MKKYAKFAALITIIVGTVVWLAFAGASETKTYYKTISEVGKMGNDAYSQHLRVGGDVEAGSIKRVGNRTQFVLIQDKERMNVIYTGTDPLPDTFKDGAQALADGKLDHDGVFRAARIQAKCASKYEAKPGSLAPGAAPNINNGKGTI